MSDDANTRAGKAIVSRFLVCDQTDMADAGWVYAVRAALGGIKIGSARSFQGVRRQITTAQTWVCGGITDVKIIHGGRDLEKYLHAQFANERLRPATPHITSARSTFTSEWFYGIAVSSWFDHLRCCCALS